MTMTVVVVVMMMVLVCEAPSRRPMMMMMMVMMAVVVVVIATSLVMNKFIQLSAALADETDWMEVPRRNPFLITLVRVTKNRGFASHQQSHGSKRRVDCVIQAPAKG
jgi:hypothetical protein